MNLTVPQTVPLAFIPCHPYEIYCLQNGTGHVSGTELRFSPVNIISPVLNTHQLINLFIYLFIFCHVCCPLWPYMHVRLIQIKNSCIVGSSWN